MGEPASMRAPIRTRNATYEWGGLSVEVNQGEDARMTIRVDENEREDDDTLWRNARILTIDLHEAPELIRLMQHALDSREER